MVRKDERLNRFGLGLGLGLGFGLGLEYSSAPMWCGERSACSCACRARPSEVGVYGGAPTTAPGLHGRAQVAQAPLQSPAGPPCAGVGVPRGAGGQLCRSREGDSEHAAAHAAVRSCSGGARSSDSHSPAASPAKGWDRFLPGSSAARAATYAGPNLLADPMHAHRACSLNPGRAGLEQDEQVRLPCL